MARVYVSIGSNVEREHNVRSCLRALEARFGPLIISSVYQNKAIGFAGDDFFNLVVGFDTKADIHSVARCLRDIEAAHDRCREVSRFAPRTLDLDLLLCDELVLEEANLRIPRAEIADYAFVLCPLAEVAGSVRHPLLGKTFAELWECFDKSDAQLQLVDMDL